MTITSHLTKNQKDEPSPLPNVTVELKVYDLGTVYKRESVAQPVVSPEKKQRK